MRPLPFLAAVLLAASATAQPAPAADYADLLDTRFFPQRGESLFDSPGAEFVLFQPAGEVANAAYVVRAADGTLVGGQRIGGSSPHAA